MRKITILLLTVLLLGAVNNVQAQRTLSKGFSVSGAIGIPFGTYGYSEAPASNYQLSSYMGVQMGHRWYFSPSKTFGVGLMINWLDISLGATGDVENNIDWGKAVFDITVLEFGPIATYAISDDIALDGYFNIRPGIVSTAFVEIPTSGVQESWVYAGSGFTHTLGAAFRWKALNVGLEYVGGGINCVGTYDGNSTSTIPDKRIQLNSLRLMVGAKF